MAERGLKWIDRLKIINELQSKRLLKEQVVIDLQTQITRSLIDEELSFEEIRAALDQKESAAMSITDSGSDFTVFICYARKDNDDADPNTRWLDRLMEQLEPLGLQNEARAWSDQQIEMGDFWDAAIQEKLRKAKAAVLLLSPAFLASKYIKNSELPVLLKRAKDDGLKILPVIVRHCALKETYFLYPDPRNGPERLSLSSLQAANPLDKPLNALQQHEQDKVLLSVAQWLFAIVRPDP
jgi:hypothetical protein